MRASALLFAATALTRVAGVPGEKDRPHHVDKEEHEHEHVEETCYGEVTVVDTKTVLSTTVVPTTCYVEVTDYIYVNTTITQAFTENSTTTLYHTVHLTDTKVETETETDIETVKVAVTETDTDSVTVTTTGTDAVTITTTDTDAVTVTTTDTDGVTVTTTDTNGVTITTTDTVPATITTYTTETETLLQTTYDPCPKSCSIDAATVTLFYWPSDRPYSYPSTYVDSDLDYTFVSPSVYMLIPSAKGTNSQGQHVGPSTTNWILGLDLDEVSTIADGPSGSLTRQLELSDLGTNCPQSVDPTAIATLSDSRCAPILAAPTTVSSWAYPCNACGRFGLFDPPYAVPTVTGLIEPASTTTITTTTSASSSSTTTTKTTATVTTGPTTSAEEPTGTIYVVYHEDGQPKSTETLQRAGISGATTSSVALSFSLSSSESSTPVPQGTETSEVLEPPMITPTAAPPALPTPSDPDTITAAAHRVHSGSGTVHAAIAMAFFSITFLFFSL